MIRSDEQQLSITEPFSDEGNFSALRETAGTLKQNGNFDEAIKTYRAAVNRAKSETPAPAPLDIAHCHTQISNAFERTKRYRKSLMAARKACATSSQSIGARVQLGRILSELKDYSGAANAFIEAYELGKALETPLRQSHQRRLLQNLRKAGRDDEADRYNTEMRAPRSRANDNNNLRRTA